MGLKERLESEKRIKSAIGFEYFKLEPMDRILFIQDLKEFIECIDLYRGISKR